MRNAAILLGLAALAACAETTPPLPPAEEVLLVLEGAARRLTVIPVDAPDARESVALGVAGEPRAVGAAGATAVIPLATPDAALLVDLRARTVLGTVPLPTGADASAVEVLDDSVAYVANAGLNTVTRIRLHTGDTASVAVGTTPSALVFTRGRLFVLNANLDPDGRPLGESWITVIDPVTNAPATGLDSIPLPGPGNAAYVEVGRDDGQLYVISAGDPAVDEGRLSIVDPVARREQASFAGVGAAPAHLASGIDRRLFITSRPQGLLEFDTERRTFVRSADDPLQVPATVGVEVDGRGQLYAVDDADCGDGAPGMVRIFRADLSPAREILLGDCLVAATLARIPPEP